MTLTGKEKLRKKIRKTQEIWLLRKDQKNKHLNTLKKVNKHTNIQKPITNETVNSKCY